MEREHHIDDAAASANALASQVQPGASSARRGLLTAPDSFGNQQHGGVDQRTSFNTTSCHTLVSTEHKNIVDSSSIDASANASLAFDPEAPSTRRGLVTAPEDLEDQQHGGVEEPEHLLPLLSGLTLGV
mgnify:CR=1 FL=1